MSNKEIQKLVGVFTGDIPGSVSELFQIHLFTSVVYYLSCAAIASLCRSLVRDNVHRMYTVYIFDFLATFEVLAMSLENIHIREHYGDNGFLIVLFFVILFNTTTISVGSSNPIAYVRKLYHGEMSLTEFVQRVFCQWLGAMCAAQYARFVWSLEITKSHKMRYAETSCEPDLTVIPLIGFAIEFGGTIVDNLMWFNRISIIQPYFEGIFKCFASAWMTLLALDLTGFYCNPLNAMNWTYNCKGLRHSVFFVVYVAAPCFGEIVALNIQQQFVAPFLKSSSRLTRRRTSNVNNNNVDQKVGDKESGMTSVEGEKKTTSVHQENEDTRLRPRLKQRASVIS